MQDNVCKICGARLVSRQELDKHNEELHGFGKKGGEEMPKEERKEQRPM